jgi:hypothetical protein
VFFACVHVIPHGEGGGSLRGEPPRFLEPRDGFVSAVTGERLLHDFLAGEARNARLDRDKIRLEGG